MQNAVKKMAKHFRLDQALITVILFKTYGIFTH